MIKKSFCWIDHSFTSPKENLAVEAIILEKMGKDCSFPILRLWESSQYFVVCGRGNDPETEVYTDRCKMDKIPVLRRVSGGGTVLQGPGCLNYAFIMPIPTEGPLLQIQSTTQSVLELVQSQLNGAFPSSISISGISDLTSNGKKFSGNAQRRTRTAILFHGTILYDFDLNLVPKYLKMPSKQPDYRENRSHLDFINNFDADRSRLVSALSQSFQLLDELPVSTFEMEKYCETYYAKPDWQIC